MKDIPYRLTIELAIPGAPKTIQVTGETPDLGVGMPVSDSELTAIAANALLWQSHAMAITANWHGQWSARQRALNLPVGRPS